MKPGQMFWGKVCDAGPIRSLHPCSLGCFEHGPTGQAPGGMAKVAEWHRTDCLAQLILEILLCRGAWGWVFNVVKSLHSWRRSSLLSLPQVTPLPVFQSCFFQLSDGPAQPSSNCPLIKCRAILLTTLQSRQSGQQPSTWMLEVKTTGRLFFHRSPLGPPLGGTVGLQPSTSGPSVKQERGFSSSIN